MAFQRTQAQVDAFLRRFRNWSVNDRRVKDELLQLKNQYDDLGLAGLTDAEVQAQNPGLTAADITAALGVANSELTEFTAARRQALNRVGFGEP